VRSLQKSEHPKTSLDWEVFFCYDTNPTKKGKLNTEKQFVYFFTNPSIKTDSGKPRVKIGKTTNIPQRKKQLFTTGVPTPFEVYKALVVPDMESTEKNIHDLLRDFRCNNLREFFDVPLYMIDSLVCLLLDLPGIEEYFEEDDNNFEYKKINSTVSLYDIGCFEGETINMLGQDLLVANSKESLVYHDKQPKSLTAAANAISTDKGNYGKRSGWDAGCWRGQKLSEYKKNVECKEEF
jgi:hypothetical protein